MPSPSTLDKRYLELHGSKWRVVVNVPKALHSQLGSKLRHQLETDSLREANRKKWDIVARLKQQIQDALYPEAPQPAKQRHVAPDRQTIIMEAEGLREWLRDAKDPEERQQTLDSVGLRAEQILGKATDYDPEHHVYTYDPDRVAKAQEFVGIARGELTPLDAFHEKYLDQAGVKKRTRDDDVRALALLTSWCHQSKTPPYIQSITKKVAVGFCDALPSLKPGHSPVTLNKTISRLSTYWAWLESRHEAEDNVWLGRRLREPQQTDETKERPFTDDEIKALLLGPAPQEMQDVMRMGALTGARLDVLVCLKVKDCVDGVFVFKPQKREPGKRLCPIHPDLMEIVQRRSEGKEPEDDLFPEWPGPQDEESLRERSFKTSNHFTEYRRSVGVDDVIPGHRRSRVNFHSFRRWFITKAEQADQPESLIAAVVGHKRNGMTLGTYSAGPLIAQARRVVEAVKLPTLEQSKVEELDATKDAA